MFVNIRPARSTDASDIVALIDAVYREYGDAVFLDGADGDLLDIEGCYHGAGGAFVVLDDGALRGTHAVLPLPSPGVCTFRRLYLEPDLRGGDWGNRLMQWAIDWAIGRGFRRVEFWSDTRFSRAHRFFARHGFARDGRIRAMDDGAMPYREHFFFRDLVRIDESQR